MYGVYECSDIHVDEDYGLLRSIVMQNVLLQCILHVLHDKKIAVGFLGDLKNVKQRIRVTKKKTSTKKSTDLVVTISRPNYLEREFLKLCRKAKTKPRRFWFPKR